MVTPSMYRRTKLRIHVGGRVDIEKKNQMTYYEVELFLIHYIYNNILEEGDK